MKLRTHHSRISYSLQLSPSSLKQHVSKPSIFEFFWSDSYSQRLRYHFITHKTLTHYEEQRLSKVCCCLLLPKPQSYGFVNQANPPQAASRRVVLSAHHASLPSPQTSLTGNLKKPLFSPHLLSGEKLCPVACPLTLPEGSRWDVFKQTYCRLHSHDSSQSLDSWGPESQLSTSQPPNCRCFATSSHTPSSPTYLSHHLWQPPQVTSPAGRWAADCKLAVCIGAWKGLRQKQESRASLSQQWKSSRFISAAPYSIA